MHLSNAWPTTLKDHTSGLSESNFDHTHRKKAIFIKQFTWQLMCKNFKKTLKINFLYLTRTLPHTNHTTSSTSAAERRLF